MKNAASNRKKRSKLKLRPHGVISFNEEERIVITQEHRKDKSLPHNTCKVNNSAHVEKGMLTTIAKGLLILLLLGLTFFGAHSKQFNFAIQSKPDQSSLTTQVENTSDNTPNNNQNSSTARKQQETQTPATADLDSAETISEKELIEETTTESLNQTGLNQAELNEPAAPPNDTLAEQPEAPAPADTPYVSTSTFIKAYKATIFSNLSADAIETPVAHGTAVILLNRAGDWVEIEITDSGATGFIHISQLNIQ